MINSQRGKTLLLRGHNRFITDLSFFSQNPSGGSSERILGSVGGEGDKANVLIWTIRESGGGNGGGGEVECTSKKIMEIRCRPAARLIWHPADPTKLIVLHRSGGGESGKSTVGATYVELRKLKTTPHEEETHPVCIWNESPDGSPTNGRSHNNGTLKFVLPDGDGPQQGGFNDLCWSGMNSRHVLTAHNDGFVRLWDLGTVRTGGIDDGLVDSTDLRKDRKSVV